jgi:hypothetical protein
MRIVNRKEFISMPAGTLYAKYQSLGFWGELAVKEDSTDFNDWFQSLLIADGPLEKSRVEIEGAPFSLLLTAFE